MDHTSSRPLGARSFGRIVLLAVAWAAGACVGPADAPSETPPVEFEGRLHVAMVADGNGETVHVEHFLEIRSDEWTRLEIPGHEQDHDHAALPGEARVRVTGTRLENGHILVATIEPTAPSSDEPGLGTSRDAVLAPTPRRVAVILANFSDDTSQPVTADAARAMVFTNAQSTNAYYREISYGSRTLVGRDRADGDVYGWFTISNSRTTCDYSAWGAAARAAAQSAGVSLTGYDHVVHYFPRSSACGWSGVGQLPGRYSWINGSSSSTIAHELGHNFGVHHASSISCFDASGARVPIGGTCSSSEYGDPFDVMGRGYRHMNAYNKGRLGFFEAANTLTVTADGTYTVAPTETASTGVQSLRVAIPGTSPQLYYYVEFRQPSTFDAFTATSSVVNGVLIHRAPDYTVLQRAQLVDTTPATTSYTDAALGVGRTFTDATNRISVTLVSVASTGARVTVDVP
jgi:hypothetical protein